LKNFFFTLKVIKEKRTGITLWWLLPRGISTNKDVPVDSPIHFTHQAVIITFPLPFSVFLVIFYILVLSVALGHTKWDSSLPFYGSLSLSIVSRFLVICRCDDCSTVASFLPFRYTQTICLRRSWCMKFICSACPSHLYYDNFYAKLLLFFSRLRTLNYALFTFRFSNRVNFHKDSLHFIQFCFLS